MFVDKKDAIKTLFFIFGLFVSMLIYVRNHQKEQNKKDILWYLDSSLVISSGYIVGRCENPRQTQIRIKESIGFIEPIVIDVCVAEVNAFKTRKELCDNLVFSELDHIPSCE